LKTGYFVRCGLDNLQFLEQSVRIEDLNLKFNALKVLPAFMGNFTQLRTLELSGNPFEKIELDLSRLDQLQELELKLKIDRSSHFRWS
jgi:Leucine-rich repeat (LRR) protein